VSDHGFDRKLRILVVLPMYGGSLPVGRYCCRALRRLGHLVEVFEAPEFHASYTALRKLRIAVERLEHLENGYLQLVSQAVLAKAQTFGPDLVLALAQAPLNRQALKKLRQDGTATAMWFVEDHKIFTYWRAFAPFYDHFAVIQKEPFLTELKNQGVGDAFYLPLAADPEFHRPMELNPVQRRKFGSDLSFVGAGYPNRRLAFRRLLGHNLKIWGSDWEGDETLWPLVQMAGARISAEDSLLVFNASKISINLHSSIQHGVTVTPGDFVNPRTFELAACGAFQIVDRRELLAELFDPDKELATFTDMDGLIQAVEHYQRHPEERQAMAALARERVLREHTYEHRMRFLLEHLAATRADGWPRSRSDAGLPEDLSPEFREELATLLCRLELQPEASFEDLVVAVRQREGRLSEIETAVLFLDEWRKQYASRH